jgi:hypothetical protein
MPLMIAAQDSRGNQISTAPDSYRLTTDHGTITYMNEKTKSADINSWENLVVMYDADQVDNSVGSDRLSINPLFPQGLLPVMNHVISFADPVLRIATRE